MGRKGGVGGCVAAFVGDGCERARGGVWGRFFGERRVVVGGCAASALKRGWVVDGRNWDRVERLTGWVVGRMFGVGWRGLDFLPHSLPPWEVDEGSLLITVNFVISSGWNVVEVAGCKPVKRTQKVVPSSTVSRNRRV